MMSAAKTIKAMPIKDIHILLIAFSLAAANNCIIVYINVFLRLKEPQMQNIIPFRAEEDKERPTDSRVQDIKMLFNSLVSIASRTAFFTS
jgi:hypothetical protein